MIRECVILAGGQGTRLRGTLPDDTPKALAPVAGAPFLDLLCASLARAGIRRVIFSLGYLAHAVIRHVGERFMGMETACVVEDAPLGTGGGLRLAMRECRDDAVLALNGDTFIDIDLPALSACWRESRAPIILGVRVEDASRYGRLVLRGEDVVGMTEKGVAGPGFINAGSYVFPTNLLDRFPPGQPFSLERDFLVPALQARPFRLFRAGDMFIDIGVPDDSSLAQRRLAHLKAHVQEQSPVSGS